MSLDHHYRRKRLIDQQRRLDAIRQSDLRADFNRLHQAVANCAPKSRDYRAVQRSMDRRLAALNAQQATSHRAPVVNGLASFKQDQLDHRFDPWAAARGGRAFFFCRKV